MPLQSLPPLDADTRPFDLLDQPRAERNDYLETDLAEMLPQLERLLGASHVAQEEIVAFRERYDRLPEDTPLPPRSLRSMHEGRSLYLRLQGHLIGLARRYKDLLDPDDAELERLGIAEVLRARAVLTSFAAALSLYDNYLSMRFVLEDDRLRRLIANPVRGYGMKEQEVLDTVEELNSDGDRSRLRGLVKGYSEVREKLEAMDDAVIDRLSLAIESSVAYRYAMDATLGKHLPTDARRWREKITDGLEELGRGALGLVSKWFGNGIGMVEMRKGKLYGDEPVEQHLRAELKPLDLLLEKTPFRLTDKFIPGHFGHAAVWVGTIEELDALGIWDDPMFQEAPFDTCRASVAEGRSVLEALRPGVQLSSLAEFLNVDDVAVLRPRHLTETEVRDSLLRAFRQVGKQYDFNFEVETLDKITCSELPYHVYPGMSWETDMQLGQHTISPDQVAEQMFGDDPAVELVDFYHDGKHVDPTEAMALLKRLLAEG